MINNINNINKIKDTDIESAKITKPKNNITQAEKSLKKQSITTDNVTLSDTYFQQATNERNQKIETLKKQINNGTFKINPDVIATKIFSDKYTLNLLFK